MISFTTPSNMCEYSENAFFEDIHGIGDIYREIISHLDDDDAIHLSSTCQLARTTAKTLNVLAQRILRRRFDYPALVEAFGGIAHMVNLPRLSLTKERFSKGYPQVSVSDLIAPVMLGKDLSDFPFIAICYQSTKQEQPLAATIYYEPHENGWSCHPKEDITLAVHNFNKDKKEKEILDRIERLVKGQPIGIVEHCCKPLNPNMPIPSGQAALRMTSIIYCKEKAIESEESEVLHLCDRF